MSQKPIFVVTHPRACSTAFERVFMTRRTDIRCIHEPFGDAFYYGPERLSTRFAHDEQARLDSGFSKSTFKTVLDRIDREASEDENKRVFIKDIIHYLLPPDGKPASIAPSLNRIKRGVGTEGIANGANGSANGHAEERNGVANGHIATVNGTNGTTTTNGHAAENDHGHSCAEHMSNGHATAVGAASLDQEPYPYATEAEPGNPTVMPTEVMAQFHFAFLIRDPHFSVPSYFRCTIPPLDEVTGFHEYYPNEAGYDEVRRVFDHLRNVRLIGPHVATREDEDDDSLKPVVNGNGALHESGAEICVVDADDMLDKPAPMIEAFCRSVGLEYTPAMLNWDTDEDQQVACDAFEKWRGFHNDAIESRGLVARTHKRPVKTEAQFDAEWREKYGEKAAAIIRKTVDDNMADYLYMKQFAMRV